MNLPVIPMQVEAEQPESLRKYFRERLQHYRAVSVKLPGPHDPRYQLMADGKK